MRKPSPRRAVSPTPAVSRARKPQRGSWIGTRRVAPCTFPQCRVAEQDCSRSAPEELLVKVSLQAAQALQTLLAERDCATANTWLWPNLHHTCLEPPNREPVGECTSQCRHCRHLLSPLWRLAKVSGDARPDGRLPACAWGDVARGLNPYPSHYRTAFASSIFPFPHIYRLALRLAFPCGRRTGLPCSVSVTHEWVRRALSTGSV